MLICGTDARALQSKVTVQDYYKAKQSYSSRLNSICFFAVWNVDRSPWVLPIMDGYKATNLETFEALEGQIMKVNPASGCLEAWCPLVLK